MNHHCSCVAVLSGRINISCLGPKNEVYFFIADFFDMHLKTSQIVSMIHHFLNEARLGTLPVNIAQLLFKNTKKQHALNAAIACIDNKKETLSLWSCGTIQIHIFDPITGTSKLAENNNAQDVCHDQTFTSAAASYPLTPKSTIYAHNIKTIRLKYKQDNHQESYYNSNPEKIINAYSIKNKTINYLLHSLDCPISNTTYENDIIILEVCC